MRALLTPNMVCKSIFDIPLDSLKQTGYDTLWLDVDNTIVGVDERDVSLRTQNWIVSAKSIGFNVFILSNNRSQKRIERICNQLDIDGLYKSMKPMPYSIQRMARQHRVSLRRSIVVGDQLFTDIILANWVRAYSVLVDPLDKKLSLFKTVQRELELFFLGHLQ